MSVLCCCRGSLGQDHQGGLRGGCRPHRKTPGWEAEPWECDCSPGARAGAAEDAGLGREEALLPQACPAGPWPPHPASGRAAPSSLAGRQEHCPQGPSLPSPQRSKSQSRQGPPRGGWGPAPGAVCRDPALPWLLKAHIQPVGAARPGSSQQGQRGCKRPRPQACPHGGRGGGWLRPLGCQELGAGRDTEPRPRVSFFIEAPRPRSGAAWVPPGPQTRVLQRRQAATRGSCSGSWGTRCWTSGTGASSSAPRRSSAGLGADTGASLAHLEAGSPRPPTRGASRAPAEPTRRPQGSRRPPAWRAPAGLGASGGRGLPSPRPRGPSSPGYPLPLGEPS